MTVFGATGGIGWQVVARLRADGHTVTAYVRNPDKVPSTWTDAVISALGPSLDRRATGLRLVEGTRTTVAAMQQQGVCRHIGIGTPSVLDPRETPT